ncbi:MAG: hypothetical protein CW336_06835 [Bacteroidetes bacterium]|nr:hypothetical protein [Bacteroidota bacterium]
MNDYKRIGDYIREVNVRNRELRVTNLMGISMTKKFRPSTSNVVGTDLSNYKIVSKNIFVFDTMSVIRVHKVPIAINNTDEPIIVSPAYHTFEVIDKNTLMPEYLMMWFCRPEFDRYADFKSDSAIRGGYGWDELCDTIIDVPTLARQREIVAEYETLTRRIRLNEQMIAKLEETAQALYRKIFVDNIDKENLPEGWRMGTLGEICKCISGYPFDGEAYSEDTGIIALRGENVTEQSLRWNIVKRFDGKISERINKCFLNAWDIVIGMDGSKVGKNWSFVYNYNLPLLLAQRVACLRTGSIEKQVFIYLTLRMEQFAEYVSRVNTGSTILHISTSQIEDFPIPIPTSIQYEVIRNEWVPMYEHICLIEQENEKLTELQSLLLARMGK